MKVLLKILREEIDEKKEKEGDHVFMTHPHMMVFCPLPLLYPSASDFQFRHVPVTVGSGRVGQNLHTSDRFYSVSAKRNKAFYSLSPNK